MRRSGLRFQWQTILIILKISLFWLQNAAKFHNWLKYSKIVCSQVEKGVKIVIMKKTIITVVGKDTVGIIAKVCTYLAENKVNILDISQTIVDDYFNMMMIADMSNAVKSVSEVSDDLDKIGEDIGVIIRCQREEIFNSMHRL